MGREPRAALLRCHRDLIALRRAQRGFADGRLERVAVRLDEDERWPILLPAASVAILGEGRGPRRAVDRPYPSRYPTYPR